jgi:hypothetical protein
MIPQDPWFHSQKMHQTHPEVIRKIAQLLSAGNSDDYHNSARPSEGCKSPERLTGVHVVERAHSADQVKTGCFKRVGEYVADDVVKALASLCLNASPFDTFSVGVDPDDLRDSFSNHARQQPLAASDIERSRSSSANGAQYQRVVLDAVIPPLVIWHGEVKGLVRSPLVDRGLASFRSFFDRFGELNKPHRRILRLVVAVEYPLSQRESSTGRSPTASACSDEQRDASANRSDAEGCRGENPSPGERW